MRGNIKTLGLALVAVLAMSAVAASAAQALTQAKFTADAYPAVIKGAQEGTENFLEATAGRKTECKTATYQATLTEASTELTVTPHYAECEASGVGTTVDLNGCDFRFTAGTNTSAEDSHGSADIVCPGPIKSITVTTFTCTVHIPAQNGLTGVTFTNKSASTVTVDVDITNQIKYTETDGFLCPFEGNTEGSDGDFVSKVTVHGFKDGQPQAHPTTEGVTTYGTGAATAIDVR